ncbi:MAG TPA: substrate-binding domain-containing protein [Baekduia sp.]|uniref:sugar ABC transporter substrate-binding protein n=1 Tax=Baekduia sp. TaxID=2600305 RepID=UPI002D787D11|nr:substrate-binding domain-containing protein [Baekduia sp.]HET6509129.1 substrate-binding domain-containing protein [Baekduia sp.]
MSSLARGAQKLVATILAALLGTAALAGCGSSAPAGTGRSTAGSGDALARSATIDKAVSDAFHGSTFRRPAEGSPAAVPGKTVWLISAGLGIPETVDYAQHFRAAAKALGWNARVYDGKFEPNEQLTGVRGAVQAKVDAILLYAIDCAPVRAGLEQARRAGIVIVGSESADCDRVTPPGPHLFSGETRYTQGDLFAWERFIGRLQADYVLWKTKGAAEVVVLDETDSALTRLNYEGFAAEMKAQCPACASHPVEITGADIGPALQQKVRQALLRYPRANAFVAPYDGLMTGGAAGAIRASGRNDRILSVAGVGQPSAISLIRSDGGLDAGYGVPLGWEAYDSMDIINRIFAKAKLRPSGIGLSLYDAGEGLPAKGKGYVPPIDYVSAYEAAWAGGSR